MAKGQRSFLPGIPAHILVLYGLLLILTPLSVHVIYSQWDRATLRSPVCRAGAPSAKHLPKLVIFLGSEGGAHDLFEFIFSALPTHVSIERFDPTLHLTSADSQTTAAADNLRPPQHFCPKLPYARRLHDFGVEISGHMKEKAPNEGMTYVRVRDPFPMGRIRTPLARPDPVALGTFHGLYYDLKAIVLVRNLTKTAMWSVSRSFHNEDPGLQLRLIEDSLTYMDASMRTLPCGTYTIIDVDKMHDNQDYVAGQLASFLSLPNVGRKELSVAIQVAYSRWEDYAPGQAGVVGAQVEPTFGGQRIDFFFSQRAQLWPLLEAATDRAFFLPTSPFSWP